MPSQSKHSLGLAQNLVNQWRDTFNPLAHLNMPTLTHLLNEGKRGAYTQIQNLYCLIEKRDATLRACRRRLQSSVGSMSYMVAIKSQKDNDLEALSQQEATQEFLDTVRNFRSAITFLSSAEFRGYAHIEKIYHHKNVPTELTPIPQEYWVRKGAHGDWQFNPRGRIGTIEGISIEPENFIIREVPDPVDEIASICFLRKSLSQKDWDAFLETYGIPWLFVVLPEYIHADTERQEEILEQMNQVASDSRGVLAHGSKIETADPNHRGKEPFSSHIRYQDEQIVLAATSGKLTILSESGTGTLASTAHQKSWDEIAAHQASMISDVFQQQLVEPFLRKKFGKEVPIYVKFSLEPKQTQDDLLKIANAVDKLANHNYRISSKELSQRTGYNITEPPRFLDGHSYSHSRERHLRYTTSHAGKCTD